MLHERSATPPAAAGPAATRSPAVSVCLGPKGARLCFQGLQGRSQGKRGRDKVGRREDVVSRASEAAPAPAEADVGGLSGVCAGDAAVPAGRRAPGASSTRWSPRVTVATGSGLLPDKNLTVRRAQPAV